MDVYARLMGDGASMEQVDRMDLIRYLDVLGRELERRDEQEVVRGESRDGKTVELRRGTIDMVLG